MITKILVDYLYRPKDMYYDVFTDVRTKTMKIMFKPK